MPTRAQELKKAITEAGGKAVVLVHPFYHEKYRALYGRLSVPTDSAEGRKFLERQKQVALKSKLPVVVLAEFRNAWRAKKEFGENVFVVETGLATSEPLAGWARVMRLLKQGGLKHVLVGGQMLFCGNSEARAKFNKEMGSVAKFNYTKATRAVLKKAPALKKYGKRPYRGCVQGALYEFARHGIEIHLMRGVLYPHKPE